VVDEISRREKSRGTGPKVREKARFAGKKLALGK